MSTGPQRARMAAVRSALNSFRVHRQHSTISYGLVVSGGVCAPDTKLESIAFTIDNECFDSFDLTPPLVHFPHLHLMRSLVTIWWCLVVLSRTLHTSPSSLSSLFPCAQPHPFTAFLTFALLTPSSSTHLLWWCCTTFGLGTARAVGDPGTIRGTLDRKPWDGRLYLCQRRQMPH
ncbi:hypothetical protein CYMTET_9912 [Cymbomonas tetramitiformis]|uniref:Uncharacterized protein n=1 Tax=Cymbomonas tetramitiformis TaxID=36881 RepID=A0AAE0GQ61_9CHLO|nr:hypothetical protein CYMTET_9912 [Cymbomonas tetramitiformis]